MDSLGSKSVTEMLPYSLYLYKLIKRANLVIFGFFFVFFSAWYFV